MRPAKLRFRIAVLAASVACGIGLPAQQSTTQPSAVRHSSHNSSPQEEMKFRLVQTSVGVTRSGATWGGKTYATPSGVSVCLYIVHLDSREGARNEYEDRLKGAVKILSREKVRDTAAKSATTEDRAVIVVSDIKECKEATTILATAGRALRIIKSFC